MLIESVFPEAIEQISDLRSCLISKATASGLEKNEADEIISLIPVTLLGAGCFLDRVKKLWRYEFGLPSTLDKTRKKLWGTHMWLPVDVLFDVLLLAHKRLTADQFNSYLQKLANTEKHRDTLVEMMPIFRMDTNIPADFEVSGYGPGNTTVDWKIGPISKRQILLDVKTRMSDLYHLMDQDKINEPQHDHALLFKSVENKLNPADPNVSLQGAWINTQIAQETKNLNDAFNQLDSKKVHFCIFGDHRDDAYVLARRPEDETFLREILKMKPSMRFTFDGK